MQQGLPIFDTDPVEAKLEGGFIFVGIPVTEEAGVGIFDRLGGFILAAMAGVSVSASVSAAGVICAGAFTFISFAVVSLILHLVVFFF